MKLKKILKISHTAAAFALAVFLAATPLLPAFAEEEDADFRHIGGGFAVTGQIEGKGSTSVLYDGTNGLPTSDANCILSTSEGYILIGGYSGIIKHDGDDFERLDSANGLTNGRSMFEDTAGRIWVATNDNGIVVLDGDERVHITYKEGLPSSSVRTFSEASDGTMWVGTTAGIVTVDANYKVSLFEDERLANQSIVRLCPGTNGKIYGNTKNGNAFCIEKGAVSSYMEALDTGEPVTAIFPDPNNSDKVYMGTESDILYHGVFGESEVEYEEISISPLQKCNFIAYECGKIWVCSDRGAGWISDAGYLNPLTDIPMDNSIEMITSDYQGNLWLASSRQGVMKVVSTSFSNITKTAGLGEEVVNATAFRDGLVYAGTDRGLNIIEQPSAYVTCELTEYIGETRVRCITKDSAGNLWICCYNNDMGLICYTPEEEIITYDESNGLADNGVRCAEEFSDGSIVVGTNKGISVIKDGEVIRNIGEEDGLANSIILTAVEGENGEIYAGTDGGGMYVIGDSGVKALGRDDGLTSDVIMRIKRDEERGVYWIITSNSLEYMKDGNIKQVSSFPYTNNFDIYYADDNTIWIVSSYGLYNVDSDKLLADAVDDYRLYTIANGLPVVPTGNAFSSVDDDGTLYLAGRTGVCAFSLKGYYETISDIILGIRSMNFDGKKVVPDSSGKYTLKAGSGRLQISAAILDYTMGNPTVHMYLEGFDDTGITATQKDLGTLEYTELPYGTYKLHIQIISPATGAVYQETTYTIVKKPKLLEIMAVRVLFAALLALIVGIIVWRVMAGTIVKNQYRQIRLAKEEAEKANEAKSRFLANMSHEIRTPISTIMGVDEMILREDTSGVPEEYCKTVLNHAHDIKIASESLLGLVDDLFDITKIETGQMHISESEYDSAELIRNLAGMTTPMFEDKDLEFTIKVSPDLPRRLYGDMNKIRQVVMNLLSNAAKYTEAGSVMFSVLTRQMGESSCMVEFSVRDTGIGIKEEDKDKIFTAYERFDQEKNAAIKGTGLGLDISRQYSELMGGSLTCESVPGQGSEFSLKVEQKIVDHTPVGEFSEKEDAGARGSYKPQFIAPDADILVVDDEPMNLSVIRGLLKPTKIFITTAESGPECLEKLKYSRFDVVFLDHMMPGMDGIETVKHIRESYPDLPVYALTANTTAGGEEYYVSAGFNGYLTKPIDTVMLEKTIMKHLPEEMMLK